MGRLLEKPRAAYEEPPGSLPSPTARAVASRTWKALLDAEMEVLQGAGAPRLAEADLPPQYSGRRLLALDHLRGHGSPWPNVLGVMYTG